MIDLDAIEKRAKEALRLQEAATGGVWTTEDPGKEIDGPAKGWPKGSIIAAVARGQYVYAVGCGGIHPEADRKLIADSRTSPCPADVLALTAEVRRLREVEEAARVAHDEFAALTNVLYGQNHDVLGWHKNGDTEPFDNFYEDNIGGETLKNLGAALKGAQA